MYGHDFPNGYAIVPYEKGYVKSTHDKTVSNIRPTPLFQNVSLHHGWGCAGAP